MKVLLVTNMYPTTEKPAFGTFVYDQVEALRRAGVEIDVLFINGRQSKLNYLTGIFRFWVMLLKKRYHIVHAHYSISGFIARLQLFYPVLVTYHGAEVLDHVPGWLRFLSRRGTWWFDRIIVVNQREKDRIQGDASKIVVIPCGVNLDEFRPLSQAEARRTLELDADKPLVLWAGEYWQYEKRFELVQESMTVLQQHCPQAELVLVSGKPHSTIPLYMNACDVLLLVSRSEGSPMVIKEAMACNLPIVSTDVGDVAQVIGGVQGCYLVEPNAQNVADTLYQVLQTRQRTNGRARMEQLGGELIAQRIIAVYHDLLHRKQSK